MPPASSLQPPGLISIHTQEAPARDCSAPYQGGGLPGAGVRVAPAVHCLLARGADEQKQECLCVCGLSQAQTQRDRATGRRPLREPCSVPKRGRHEAPPAPSQLQQGWTKEADGTCSYYTTLLPASGREQRAHGKVSGLRGLGNRERVWTLTLGFPGARPGLRRVHRPVPGRPGQRASDPHGHDLQIPPRQPANPPPFPFLVFFCCYCCRAVLRLAIIKNK